MKYILVILDTEFYSNKNRATEPYSVENNFFSDLKS
jgi:hypothetical protein